MKSNIIKFLFILFSVSILSISCSMRDITGSDGGIEEEYRGNRYVGNLTDDASKQSKAEIAVNSDGSFNFYLDGSSSGVKIEKSNIVNEGNGKYNASQGSSIFDL